MLHVLLINIIKYLNIATFYLLCNSVVSLYIIIFINKIKERRVPQYLYEHIRFNRDIHEYNTIGSSNFHIQPVSKKGRKTSFFKEFNEFNHLPAMVTTHRIWILEKKLKEISQRTFSINGAVHSFSVYSFIIH